MVPVLVAVVTRTRLSLELDEEAVGREEHPVQKRGSGLFGRAVRCGCRQHIKAKSSRRTPIQVSFCKGAGDTVALSGCGPDAPAVTRCHCRGRGDAPRA